MPRIQFAIIGCGHAAAIHATQIKRFGQLAAVCDVDPSTGKVFAEKHGARFYPKFKQLLENEPTLDVVVICTPNGLHCQQAIAAMRTGCHVLVEKPMALYLRDANTMIRVAKETGRQLFTVMQNRFNPPVVAVRKLLLENRLGKLYSIQLNCFWNRNAAYYKDSWHGTRDLDGGILFTQFSHFIDLLLWLFGPVKQVKSVLKNTAGRREIDFEDTGVVLLEWKNGMLGTMHYTINAFEKNREGSLTILGEKGMVKIGGEYLNTLEYQDISKYRIKYKETDSPANDYGAYQGSMRNHNKVYESLIGNLKKNKPYYTSPEEARAAIRLIEQIMSPTK
ncbi:MAG TPA: Gfo/Idh/MocA family oxidoreductase [Sediminibacterium sp.]|nr:Gfo/Idh/MocA family oxidoreductase [Sediminibacterium sp.]